MCYRVCEGRDIEVMRASKAESRLELGLPKLGRLI